MAPDRSETRGAIDPNSDDLAPVQRILFALAEAMSSHYPTVEDGRAFMGRCVEEGRIPEDWPERLREYVETAYGDDD